jgi:DNA-binding transcriptional ArsR family regulator
VNAVVMTVVAGAPDGAAVLVGGIRDDRRCRPRHHVSMTILKQLQTDMRKLQADYQRKLVVEALRNRAQELTLGDIRKILNSPLGADLGDLRLVALFGPAQTAGAAEKRAEAKPRGATPDKSASKRSSRKRKATAKAGKQKAVDAKAGKRVGQKTVDAVWEILVALGRPVASSEIASKLELNPSTVTSALQQLRAAKRVEVSGSSKLTRYAVRSTTGPRIEPVLKPETPAATAPAPAAAKSSRPQADYDAAVLAEVSQQGPVSSTVIHTAVGGTLDEVRASLKRLVDAGRVTRSGERRFTRYTLK